MRLLALSLLLIALLSSAGNASAKELGFNVHQSSTVGIDATVESGTKWVRIDFNWFNAEPNTQGVYDWALFDGLINQAIAKKLKVLAVIGYTPAWASQADAKGGGNQNDVPKANTFAPFVTAVVNRYKANVTHWEIWNEPNLEQFFEGTPQEYIDRILIPGSDALHAACATCKVLGPGLATVGDQYAIWMDAVLGNTQAAAKLDIVSGHIYASFPTSGGGAGTTSDSFFNKLESHRVIKLGSSTIFTGPLSFKESMDKHAVTKPFWLTETGREAAFGNASELDAQTLYYRRVLEEMLQRPWWDATIFYEAFDEPPAPYKWGVVVHDESAPKKYLPKPALAFLTKVTSSQPAFGGTKTDCDDGLDNDLDGKVDFPTDTTCSALTTASEGIAPVMDGGVPADGGTSSASSSSSSSSSSGSPPSGTTSSSSSSSTSSGDGAPAPESEDGCTTTRGSTTTWAAAALLMSIVAFAMRRSRQRSKN